MVDDVTHTSKAGVPRDGHLSHLQPRRYAGGYVQPHRTTRSVVQLQLQSYRVCRLELELDTVLARRRRTSENVRERNARSPSQAPSLDGGFFDISTRTDWRTHARTPQYDRWTGVQYPGSVSEQMWRRLQVSATLRAMDSLERDRGGQSKPP